MVNLRFEPHQNVINYLVIAKEEIEDTIKPSRERSLALTKLEECELWLSQTESSK